MKTYGGVDVYIHVFLTLELVGGVVCFTPRPLYPWNPLDRRLDGPQNRSGRRGDKNLTPTGTQTPDPSAVQPVASRYTHCATGTRAHVSAVIENMDPCIEMSCKVITVFYSILFFRSTVDRSSE
jgi:hypothetical protein